MKETPGISGLQHTGIGGTVNSFVEDADPRLVGDVLSDEEMTHFQFVPEDDVLISGETYPT